MALIEVRNLTKVFAQRAVDDVSLEIRAGETLGLVGESGSGKSTLGRLILRLIEPTSGNVLFEGRDLMAAGRGEMRRMRRDMQIIFQDPFASLDPRFRVEDIVAEPLLIHEHAESRFAGPDGRERLPLHDRVTELLRAVGLDESARRRYPHEFSGGQRQRIGIARVIVRNSPILLLDEPTAALDSESEKLVIDALEKLMKGRTVIAIAHRLSTIRDADKIVVISGGVVAEDGTHEELMAQNGIYAGLHRTQFDASSDRVVS